MRRYKIKVDGVHVGDIASGGRFAVSVPVGPHLVQAALDWGRSPEVSVVVVEGADAQLVVGPGRPHLSLTAK